MFPVVSTFTLRPKKALAISLSLRLRGPWHGGSHDNAAHSLRTTFTQGFLCSLQGGTGEVDLDGSEFHASTLGFTVNSRPAGVTQTRV